MQRPQRKVKGEPGPVVQATAPARSGAMVTIACKHPGGLILRVFKMEDFNEPVMGGGFRTSQRAVKMEQQVVIKGPAVPFGVVPDFRIVGGYALTEGVPADFWAAWLKQNADSDLVKNRMIHAHESTSYMVGQAKEQRELRSGMEPINPTKDPRNVQPKNRNLTAVSTGERT